MPVSDTDSLLLLQIGYAAFGEETRDIITLNLPQDWTTVAVKLALCLGLLFTFPVMMVPVFEILERSLQQQVCHCCFSCEVSAVTAASGAGSLSAGLLS